ncbi:hypothetical protein K437DRAFT_219159 [Tilletiaria anomala UBC 951]|uniref:Protein CASP n=1 Tax=Tilletiaria anomala (strain ATCC 24038 / CBS 436.72 / UBC 951) TaxID=1037660 RepID=A0A066WH76_TILAU|nr:uncharacterized protein K437DRAFT_219159 [Tilletiaria anomala UBC 951]KDN53186.1 hypothetical protein K437DRAFT_219159 [Tilletiaria anomala UBC 951]
MASSVSTALDKWREIDLPSLQSLVSPLPDQLLSAQKESLVSRKRLAESTKEFKKQSDETKVETFKGLLKAYQSEIDSLTKRAQSAENAFLRIWKAPSGIEGAPDPYPMLEILVDQAMAISDAENLKSKHEALQQSYEDLLRKTEANSSLETDRDSIQARLVNLESSLEQRVKDRTQSLEREWAAKLDERLRNHNEEEAESKKEIARLKSQVRELRSQEEEVTKRGISQQNEADSGFDGHAMNSSSVNADMEMMISELERAQRRASDLETRNEALRAELEAARHGQETVASVQAFEHEKANLADENRKLKALVDRREKSEREAKSQEDARKRDAEKMLDSKEKELSLLRGKLERQQDYEEIKRELMILRSIEFSDDDTDGEAQVAAESSSSGLEASLLRKNRKLQDEVTTLRVQATESSSGMRQSAEEVKSLRAELARLKSLNQRLENDLVSLNGPTHTKPPKSGKTDPQSPAPNDVAVAASSFPAGTVASSANAESGILPIITSQRDRFRTRNAELEEELRKQAHVVTELRSEVSKLQADNLGLYEKLRYLQTYGSEGATGSNTPNGAGGSSSVTIGVSAHTDASGAYPPLSGDNFSQRREDRYRQKYEERMDPFQAFRGREQFRALTTLNPLERLLHTLTRLVLGHRRMRIAFMVYTLAIHILVFFMLFESTVR